MPMDVLVPADDGGGRIARRHALHRLKNTRETHGMEDAAASGIEDFADAWRDGDESPRSEE